MALIEKLSAIGDAIRAKTGKEELIPLDDMPQEISAIESKVKIKVSDGNYLFYNDARIEYIDSFDLSELTQCANLFNGCKKLINLPADFNCSKCSSIAGLCSNCINLEGEVIIDAPNLTSAHDAFVGCAKVKKIILRNSNNMTTLGGCFYNCASLLWIEADFSSMTDFPSWWFNGVEKVHTFILSGTLNVSGIPFNKWALTIVSGRSILIALKNYSGTDKEGVYTIPLHANTWALLDAEGDASPNGTTWREYATAKGWNH